MKSAVPHLRVEGELILQDVELYKPHMARCVSLYIVAFNQENMLGICSYPLRLTFSFADHKPELTGSFCFLLMKKGGWLGNHQYAGAQHTFIVRNHMRVLRSSLQFSSTVCLGRKQEASHRQVTLSKGTQGDMLVICHRQCPHSK